MSKDIDILIFSEIWLKHDMILKISKFDIIRKDRFQKKGGTAICLKKNTKFTPISNIFDCDGKI